MLKITPNTFFWVIAAGFFSAALFFTIQIQKVKSSINKPAADFVLTSGQKAKVIKIIDGDEIYVKTDNQEFTVRILGIFSFDPSVNDPLVENTAKTTFHSLEKLLLNQEVDLVFDEFLKDSNNRILSYIQINQLDIGLSMITNGHSLVYTKYPFSRMEKYLDAQRSAQKNKLGLWLIPHASERATQLQKLWKNGQAEGIKP